MVLLLNKEDQDRKLANWYLHNGSHNISCYSYVSLVFTVNQCFSSGTDMVVVLT